ncbi:MAG: hypothetical protein AAF242_09775 [Bacteroidota bacterium]
MKTQTISFTLLLTVTLILGSAFTTPNPATDAKSQDLLDALVAVNGGWNALLKLKDVEFTYTYDDKAKGIDISTERYIFGNETSWAAYQQHEVNVMPGVDGQVYQCYMDGKPAITLNGEAVNDPQALGLTTFLRKANYYWFTMMYKLQDPGTSHTYLGTEEINGITYDKVSLKFEGTGKDANDEYVLFFNPETHLVDQFLFSLPAMGVNQPVLKMELEYEKIKGVYISTTRRGIYPNPETGEYQLGGEYTITDLKFKNGFTQKDLAL